MVSSVKDLSLFEFKHHSQVTGNDVYCLKASALSENECHIFFPATACEELLIATALEYMTFHPANKRLNDQFSMNIVACKNIKLFWCHFPKEFKDVCERASKVFGLTMKIMPRVMVIKGTSLEFPNKENILCFQGNRSYNPKKIYEKCDDIELFGDILEKVGVD